MLFGNCRHTALFQSQLAKSHSGTVDAEKSPNLAACVSVATEAVYVPAAGSIEIMTPPASPTAATANGPAPGTMSKLTVKVPACSIFEKLSKAPAGPQGPGSLSPRHGLNGVLG